MSDEGYSVAVTGNFREATYTYAEAGKILKLWSEGTMPRIFDLNDGTRWEPPHDGEMIPAEHLKRIAVRVREAGKLASDTIIINWRQRRPDSPTSEQIVMLDDSRSFEKTGDTQVLYRSKNRVLPIELDLDTALAPGHTITRVILSELRQWQTTDGPVPVSPEDAEIICADLNFGLPLLGYRSLVYDTL